VIVILIFLIVAAFDIVRAFKKKEKREAAIHIAIVALVIPMALYVTLEPKFTSFAELIFGLLGIE
jgi:Kef-type K+ transport system membrane component KefB